MESPLFHSDLLTGHEPLSEVSLIINGLRTRFMGERAATFLETRLETLNREWTLIDANSLVPSPLIRVHSRPFAVGASGSWRAFKSGDFSGKNVIDLAPCFCYGIWN